MSGTLFVVATPIGNLEDITLRALRVLREAHVIAAEDTRRTARLLAHYTIATPMLSFYEHNTRTRLPLLISRLEAGERVALVTDAGTPGISDPGAELVRACVDHGIAVDPIPGASAGLTAASVSGFPLEPLTIMGFPPARAKDRNWWLKEASVVSHTFTFFEAPHRIEATLKAAHDILGKRQILVARELTKVHQELIRAHSIGDVIGQMPAVKGEFTVVVGPLAKVEHPPLSVPDELIVDEFGQMREHGPAGRRAAINAVAKKFGMSSREVYGIIEKHRKSGA
jgi:16S rRNA (cytidine1402-2'-O)-methyltransferase